jgi:Bifunctional DNA primase/polymerase, N-terminal
MSNVETLASEIGSPGNLPYDLARKIGAAPKNARTDDEPVPETMLGWAIHWAERGLYVFPCKSWLGSPISPKWYSVATNSVAQIVEWWSETPNADIAAIPDRSGHFVIAAVGPRGLTSLKTLETQYGKLSPLFTTETACSSLHLWFKGRAVTSRNLLGPGLHVCGPGTFVYMPASLAPDPE